MSFSQNMQYLRKLKGITQEKLADTVGVSRQSVSKWETGDAFPETEKIMQLCDIFGINIVGSMMMARILNLLFYATVAYFAIRKLKSGGLILATILIAPSPLFLAANFSYDYFVTVCIAYSLAYVIYEIQNPEKPVGVSDCVKMFGAMIIGCGPKAIYFLLLAPALFMKKNKFSSEKAFKYYRLGCILSMSVILASFIIPFFIDTGAITDGRGGSDVNSTEQLKFILSDPFGYVKILVNFLLDYVSFTNSQPFTVSFAYLGFGRAITGTLAIFVMLLAAFYDKDISDDIKGAGYLRLFNILVSIAAIALVATSLYIAFTPVGHSTVLGCQYRYIFPVLFLILYSIGSGKAGGKVNKNHLAAAVFSLISFNLILSYCETLLKQLG